MSPSLRIWGEGLPVGAFILIVEEETRKLFCSTVMTDRTAVGFVKTLCMDMCFLKMRVVLQHCILSGFL